MAGIPLYCKPTFVGTKIFKKGVDIILPNLKKATHKNTYKKGDAHSLSDALLWAY